MSAGTSTTSQIRAQVATIYKKRPGDRIIGIKTGGRWEGAERELIGDREFRFVQCYSPLEVRESLIESDGGDTTLVVVTDLDERDIGFDVLARFAKRRLHPLRAWQLVVDLFQARTAAPTLFEKRWLAEALLANLPPQGYPPVASGVLDEDTVWGIVLRVMLGFETTRPDASDVLVWSLKPENLVRYSSSSADLRAGVRSRIAESAGEVAHSIFNCIDSGHAAEVMPIGLACHVIFSEDASGELREGAARLERFIGGKTVPREPARLWGSASAQFIDKLIEDGETKNAMRLLERSDQIVREVRLESRAYVSDYSPLGFELRLRRYGEGLVSLLKEGSTTPNDYLIGLARDVSKHRLASLFPERAERVEMSMRLSAWLSQQDKSEPASFEQAARKYTQEGGFVDWARHHLYGGENVEALSNAYGSLAEIIAEKREVENKRFGELLVNWIDVGSSGGSVLLVEEVLKEVVAKVARLHPVLLIVMDGMSYAVFRELIEDISSRGWIQWGVEGEEWPRPVIAALPSVTEVSRTSLLCGKLAKGGSSEEISGFESNAELLAVSKSGYPPLLFHKSGLSDSGGADLALGLRKEIASDKRKVTGVVVNAVDDHLLKGTQVSVPWLLKHVPVLDQLLFAARDSGRIVILTSDHGHILERQTEQRRNEPGERYRLDDGPPLADELAVNGSRVVTPGNRMIAPWAESVRYGLKKHGYHGGITPQECVIPLAVLSTPNQVLDGWSDLPQCQPVWWDILNAKISETMPVMAKPAHVVQKAPPPLAPKLPLFAPAEETTTASTAINWVDALLKSPAFTSQRKLSGRLAPPLDLVRSFLTALEERGGTMLKLGLAQRLGQPEMRIHGIVAAMRRLLNVDGYAVLSVDEASGSVMLNRELLKVQFDLE